jgi:hypothetical protein
MDLPGSHFLLAACLIVSWISLFVPSKEQWDIDWIPEALQQSCD